MSFLQKTALNLVKCGLHRPSYYLHPHIGGPHSVLYFTIEKYSNSNVLVLGPVAKRAVQTQVGKTVSFGKVLVFLLFLLPHCKSFGFCPYPLVLGFCDVKFYDSPCGAVSWQLCPLRQRWKKIGRGNI